MLLFLAASIVGCTDDDIPENGAGGQNGEEDAGILRIALVLGDKNEQQDVFAMLEWLQEEMQEALGDEFVETGFDTIFIDDPYWEFLLENTIARENVVAVIAPTSSEPASKVFDIARRMFRAGFEKKGIIFPLTTSLELQKRAEGHNWAVFLTESDLSQSEMLVAANRLFIEADTISSISKEGLYSNTFRDYIPFFAEEWEQPLHINVSLSDEQADKVFDRIAGFPISGQQDDRKHLYLIASDELSDYSAIDSLLYSRSITADEWPRLLFVDNIADSDLTKLHNCYGISIAPEFSANDEADDKSLFETRFQEYALHSAQTSADGMPLRGEANIYDALLLAQLVAYKASNGVMGYYDALQDMIDVFAPDTCSWHRDGIAKACEFIRQGRDFVIRGASGVLDFENGSRVNTNYYLWKCHGGKVNVLHRLSSSSLSRRKNKDHVLNDWVTSSDYYDVDYQPLQDHYAIIVSASQGWKNYRHEADALAFYQLLKMQGYDDDHILLITNDEMANHPSNPAPGEVRAEKDGSNLYAGAVVDYRTTSLTPEQLQHLLTASTEFAPTANDNVIVFWAGHGHSNGSLGWGDNGSIKMEDLVSSLRQMKEADRFRKMSIFFETCYSGRITALLKENPIDGLMCISASDHTESSLAHGDASWANTYLCDEFTVQLLFLLYIEPDIHLDQLFFNVYLSTYTSHPSITSMKHYDNFSTSNMGEYLLIKE